MSDLKGLEGELRFTIDVKRGDTGETETYELIGKILTNDEELEDGSNTLDSGS